MDEITFLEERTDDYLQLRDLNWQDDLAFLASFAGKLSALYLKLQDKNKNNNRNDAAFQSRTTFMIVHIQKKKIQQFVNNKHHIEKHPTYNLIPDKLTSIQRKLKQWYQIWNFALVISKK